MRLLTHYDIAVSCLRLWPILIPTSFSAELPQRVMLSLSLLNSTIYLRPLLQSVKIILNPNFIFKSAWRPLHPLIVWKHKKKYIITLSKSLIKTLNSSGWGQAPLLDTSYHPDKELLSFQLFMQQQEFNLKLTALYWWQECHMEQLERKTPALLKAFIYAWCIKFIVASVLHQRGKMTN